MALKKTKTKAPALNVPQTDAAADGVLAMAGDVARALGKIETDMKAELAAVKAKYEALAEPFKTSQKTFTKQLSAFAEAHRDRLTDKNKTKTVKFPAGRFGWRTRPPSVAIKRGTDPDTIITLLQKFGMRRFIRLKYELNKDRMLDEPDAINDAKIEGLSIVSGVEDFYVEPFGADLAEVRDGG